MPGTIGANENSTSVSALLNYDSRDRGYGRSIEFVFDAETNTFVVGKLIDNLGGLPHEQLAKSIGSSGASTTLGGTFSIGTNGEIFTTENSGYYGQKK